ncbi:hypothetical protein HOC13_02335 [Candidatus Woesearchaeota archaeon]|jgi:hypothetical protein|nr:hypothetical protein [Candidatus Woesearchaeota archaeon]
MGFFKTWKTVILDPKVFFSKLPNKMGLREPSIFYLKLQTISWLLVAIVMGFWLIPSGGFSLVSSLFGGVGILVGLLLGILTVVVMIFLSWGMMFVGAGVIHLFVRAFGGIKEYKETFKAMAYGSAPGVLSSIPLLGWLASIYSVILQVIGLSERQKLSLARSVAAVLVPTVLFGAIFLGLAILFFGWISKSFPM